MFAILFVGTVLRQQCMLRGRTTSIGFVHIVAAPTDAPDTCVVPGSVSGSFLVNGENTLLDRKWPHQELEQHGVFRRLRTAPFFVRVHRNLLAECHQFQCFHSARALNAARKRPCASLQGRLGAIRALSRVLA